MGHFLADNKNCRWCCVNRGKLNLHSCEMGRAVKEELNIMKSTFANVFDRFNKVES